MCPILYAEPIVQNLGYLLRGVQKPLPLNDKNVDDDAKGTLSDHPVPYHKTVLLDQVTKLYIIHASSRTPLKNPYIQAGRPEIHWDGELTALCDVDCLAAADLRGWRRAERILSRLPTDSKGELSISFAKLQSLSYNTWDDGRWGIYDDKARSVRMARFDSHYNYNQLLDDYSNWNEIYGDAWVDVCPSQFVTELFEQIFLPVLASQVVSVCHGSQSVPGGMIRDKAIGWNLYHGSAPTTSTAPSPTRVYLSAVSAAQIALTTEPLGMRFVFLMQHAFARAVCQTVSEKIDAISAAIPILEICISTQIEGQEGELQEAQAKEAVERFFKAEAEVPKACLGRFRVLIGDEVTPCPACGAKAKLYTCQVIQRSRDRTRQTRQNMFLMHDYVIYHRPAPPKPTLIYAVVPQHGQTEISSPTSILTSPPQTPLLLICWTTCR